MGDKDPSPFGYTFNGSFLDSEPTPYDANQSLLTDIESQSIADFFTNTDPFHLSDPHAFAPAADTKDSIDGFNDWSNFVTPATVHGVSTTVPDQAHLQNNFFNDHTFAQQPLHANHYGNTHDELQAAQTLFHNSQSSYTNNRFHSFHGVPSSSRNSSMNRAPSFDQNGKPMVVTQHGMINEQLAALLPKYAEEGTIDAQLAAHWATSDAQQRQEAEFGELLRGPSLQRSYTFGTDDSFSNPAGFSASHGQESTEQVTQRLLRDLRHAQPLTRTAGVDGTKISPSGHIHLSPTLPDSPSDDEQSEEATSDEDVEDRPPKKRRKSSYGKNTSQKRARNGKNRKASAAEESGKKKRASAAAQKLQRENLTEEQKRSNHILSEQKRRNLIKRGFDDLHDLVPEIRNGGLSKSSVLTEAANFLEKLIEDNVAFRKLAGG